MNHRQVLITILLAGALLIAPPSPSAESSGKPDRWWGPGEERTWPQRLDYDDASGQIGVLRDGAALTTRDHPFFTALGPNGRACVTCHQPADGMSLSAATARSRWTATGGHDPLFAAIDGSNCPTLPQDQAASHSLLLTRGLIRIALPWPPRDVGGAPVNPEFDIEVVRDPTGCNSGKMHGLSAAQPTISVYRRPRPLANTKYTTHQNFGVLPFIGKNGLPASRDPETGKPSAMNLMSDARAPTLKVQAADAAATHLQMKMPLTAQQLAGIVEFEQSLYVAQARSSSAGSLEEPDGPSGLGPAAMKKGEAGVLGNNTTRWVIPMEDKWKALPRGDDAATNTRNAARESIQRGHDIYMFRTFWIRDSMHLNSVGLGNPAKRTCATCHGMHMTGMDTANGWMDIGSTNLPWAKEQPLNPWNPQKPDLPLFKVTCKAGVAPHPFLGRVIYTQDPGRALISGRCNDVGTIVMQQLRGLAARPPYFSNGSAATLREVVDFYDRRYSIGYSEQEKQDLVNFLEAL